MRTPEQALAHVLEGDTERGPSSPLDYKDNDQIAVQVLIDGIEPWVLLLRRGAEQ